MKRKKRRKRRKRMRRKTQVHKGTYQVRSRIRSEKRK